jgi:hypothetical protein
MGRRLLALNSQRNDNVLLTDRQNVASSLIWTHNGITSLDLTITYATVGKIIWQVKLLSPRLPQCCLHHPAVIDSAGIRLRASTYPDKTCAASQRVAPIIGTA